MNEELLQRGYYKNGNLKGEPYGQFEKFELGATRIGELESVGLARNIPARVEFPFNSYTAPRPKSTKPDGLFCSWESGTLQIVANKENKRPTELNTAAKKAKAFEQGFYAGVLLGSRVAIVTDETNFFYIDIAASLEAQSIVLLQDSLSLNPGLLEDILRPERGVMLDPGHLAEKVWQAIWHATKEEPKACLLTFVEIFVLKFLSDNLPNTVLAQSFSVPIQRSVCTAAQMHA
jgi:type I restriction enzyme M protein